MSRLVALIATLTLLLAACSGDASDTDATSGQPDTGSADEPMASVAPDETPDDVAADAEDSETEGARSLDPAADETDAVSPSGADGESTEPTDRAVPPDLTALFVGRQIVKTGEVVLEAADVAATSDAIIDTIFAEGGAIWGQETESDPTPRAIITIRVPPTQFESLIAALTRVEGVGVVSQMTTSDDVTEVVVDLDARISAAESSVARVQVLLDEARDLNTIFELEEELSTRQADLERLLGQRKTIGDQVALSTITLTIVELDPDRLQSEMEVIAWLGDNRDEACPGSSDLSIGSDDDAVLCVNISNTGEDALTEINVASPTFRLRVDDFTVEAGTADLTRIEPGAELLLTAELRSEDGFIKRVDASDGTTIAVDVIATPETAPSVELTGTNSVVISTDVDDPLPGFGDSLSGGWSAMIAVVSVVMIIVGVLLPFIPILILAVWLGRKAIAGQRRRGDEREADLDTR